MSSESLVQSPGVTYVFINQPDAENNSNNKRRRILYWLLPWLFPLLISFPLSPWLKHELGVQLFHTKQKNAVYQRSNGGYMPLKEEVWRYTSFCEKNKSSAETGKKLRNFDKKRSNFIQNINKLEDTFIVDSPRTSIERYYGDKEENKFHNFIIWFNKHKSQCSSNMRLYSNMNVWESKLYTPMQHTSYSFL